ncbi:MAG: protein kinase [Myxococcota bacterium]
MSIQPAKVERPLPDRVGRYRILAELGQGGMAIAYLGRAVGPGGFERLFAIKMIHEHLCREPAFVSMFLNEARLVARIQHPNVIPVYEVDVENGRYYLSLDYVSGETLAQTLWATVQAKKKLPVEAAATIVAHAAQGLHAAHELRAADGRPLGVVHRDVAPQNLMIGYDGLVRLMDFGVAKAHDQLHHSRPGTLKGTVAYMAPEHLRGSPIDRRADVFSLGVVLWEALAGKRLFKAKSDLVTGSRVLKLAIPSLAQLQPECSPRLEAVVLRALAREPTERYSSAQEFCDELLGVLATEGRRCTSGDLQRLMLATFQERREQRREMEQLISPPAHAPLRLAPAATSESGLIPEGDDENFAAVIEVVDGPAEGFEAAPVSVEAPTERSLPRLRRAPVEPPSSDALGDASIARALGPRRSRWALAGLAIAAIAVGSWFALSNRAAPAIQPPAPVVQQPPLAAIPTPAAEPAPTPTVAQAPAEPEAAPTAAPAPAERATAQPTPAPEHAALPRRTPRARPAPAASEPPHQESPPKHERSKLLIGGGDL